MKKPCKLPPVSRMALMNAHGSGAFGEGVSPEPPASSGPKSLCEEHRETIQAKLDAGLSMQRIHQDLKADGFAGSYYSVMP